MMMLLLIKQTTFIFPNNKKVGDNNKKHIKSIKYSIVKIENMVYNNRRKFSRPFLSALNNQPNLMKGNHYERKS